MRPIYGHIIDAAKGKPTGIKFIKTNGGFPEVQWYLWINLKAAQCLAFVKKFLIVAENKIEKIETG